MTYKIQKSMLLVVIVLLLLLILVVRIALASFTPEPPEGCQIAVRINWESRGEVLHNWGGADHTPPYDDLCGMAVRVDDVWYSNTEWNCPKIIDDVYSSNCEYAKDGVSIWNRTLESDSGIVRWVDAYSPGSALQEGIIWDYSGVTLSQEYRLFIPKVMHDWGVCLRGCVGPPPLP